MHTSLGKPLVALVSAACLSAPATVPAMQHQLSPAESHMAVRLSAATSTLTTSSPVDTAAVSAALNSLADLSGVDKATLILQLLTAPYHNYLGISKSVGTAANAGLQAVSLPFSIFTFVLANQTDQIPKYIATVQANLKSALPGIQTAIQNEIAYDKNLFAQLFGTSTPNALTANAVTNAVTAAADPISQGTLLLQLLSLPYHNYLGISKAVGTAANSGLQLISLPFSIATFVLANQTDQIPKYIATVKANLKSAVPGIQTAIKSELAYDKSIISQVFGGSTTTQTALTVNARQTPNLLAANETESTTSTGTSEDKTSIETATAPKPTWAQKLADKAAEKKAAKAEKDASSEDTTTETSDKTESASSDQGSSDKGSSDKGSSDKASSDKASDATTDKTSSDKTSSDKTSSDKTSSDKTSSDKASDTKSSASASTGGKHRKADAA